MEWLSHERPVRSWLAAFFKLPTRFVPDPIFLPLSVGTLDNSVIKQFHIPRLEHTKVEPDEFGNASHPRLNRT